ncbi:MAG: purine-nucleoside phosphorylase [Nitrososphaerota archaeon]
MREPQHLKTRDVAQRVVVAGDPARVVQLAKMLKDARLVNENRGFITYTGTYDGAPVTVACHGVGGPSAAVVFEELVMLGARVVVRLGSTGGFLKEMKLGEVVVPTGAAYLGGTLKQYIPDDYISPVPSFDVLTELVRTLDGLGLKYYLGPVFSSDAFYAEDPQFLSKWVSRGYISVEMECATLFGLGMMRGVKTGSILLISDNLAEMTPMVDAEYLRPYVEKAGHAALQAITNVKL